MSMFELMKAILQGLLIGVLTGFPFCEVRPYMHPSKLVYLNPMVDKNSENLLSVQ